MEGINNSYPEIDAKKKASSSRSKRRTKSLEDADSDPEIDKKKKHSSSRSDRRTKSSGDYDSDPEIDKKKKHSSSSRSDRRSKSPADREVKRRGHESRSKVTGIGFGVSVEEERKSTRTADRERQDREAKRKARQNRLDSSGGNDSLGQSNHDVDKGDRDREAKRRARRPASNKDLKPGALSASNQDDQDRDRDAKRRARREGSNKDLKPGVLSVSNQDDPDRDRDVKRRARRQGSNKELKPGAVSSGGEHKSRTKARRANRGSSPHSADSSDELTLDAQEIQKLRQAARENIPGAVASNNDNMISSKTRRNTQRTKKSNAGKKPAKNPGESEIAISAATSKDENGEFAAVAEMVDEETENERIERMVAEKERQIREELAAANTQVNGDDETGDKDEGESEQSSGSGKKICCAIFCLLLISGGVVGALFATGTFSPGPEVVSPGEMTETDSPTNAVTDSPTTPVPTTDLPSSSPTFLVFDQPDVDTCQLISEGEALEGQDQWLPKNFVIQLDAELSLLSEEELLYPEIQDRVQQITMPKLAGCEATPQRLRRLSGVHDGTRMLNDPFKYVVGNGVVLKVVENTDGCLSSTEPICISVKIEITIYLQEETSNFDVLTRLSTAFNSGVNLTGELGLGGPFKTLIAVEIRSLDPTMEPSMAPSFIPSESPTTKAPTDVPSSRPTFAPVSFPTTSAPTVSPSEAPSTTPSIAPVEDTVAPVPAPTELPSSIPSKRPSAAPVVGETPVPTQTPSRTPSRVPSVSPSTIPSLKPSQPPSLSPSEVPSTVPSSYPSSTPSVQPSSPAPTETTRESLVVSALNSFELFDLDAQALDWLVNEDVWPTDNAYELVERYALAALYYNWNGANWNNNGSWMSGISVCSWHKTACRDGVVTSFIMNTENVGDYQPFPSAIGAMTSLTRLELGTFQIASFENGSIPSAITKLTKMQLLTLKDIGITSVGSELTALRNLKKLVLRENGIPGAFPTSLLSLTKLTYLDIAVNQFVGELPEQLSSLSLMVYLALNDNSWGTSIPTSIGEMTKLRSIYTQKSQMTGNIPTTLVNIAQLHTFQSHNNNHSGPIPPLPMANLHNLNLHSNNLTGSIPALSSELESCRLYNNDFDTPINYVGVCILEEP